MKLIFSRPVLLISLFVFIVINNTYSQDVNTVEKLKNGKEITYKALVKHDKDMLLEAHAIYADLLKTDKADAEALYGLTFTEYRLLEMSLQKGNDSLFDEYYQQAKDNANKLILTDKYLSAGKSLLAGIYMMKIATSPMAAVTLSSEIYGLLDDAEKADPLNSAAFIVRGEMKYNTPKLFGGSFEEAVKNFNKAISICEQSSDGDDAYIKWEYLESLAWLGRSYVKLGNYDAAKFAYQKALNIQPEFGWVKYVLLPEAEKNAKN